jgi:hypothetical protein
MFSNNFGHDNVATGFEALKNSSGSSNIALGSGAGRNLSSGSHNIEIGNAGKAAEERTIRIGNTTQTAAFLAGVNGTSIPGTGRPVLVNGKGQLGTSSAAPASADGGRIAIGELRARIRRQGRAISTQRTQIYALRREVTRLSRR